MLWYCPGRTVKILDYEYGKGWPATWKTYNIPQNIGNRGSGRGTAKSTVQTFHRSLHLIKQLSSSNKVPSDKAGPAQ